MLDVDIVEKFYTYFYQHKYYDYRYKFKRTKTTKSVCESFLKIVDEEYSLYAVTENFLWEYFLFQWQYWNDLSLENKFSDKVAIAYIVGKKAFDRWKERDKEYDWQIESYKIVKEYNLDKKELVKDIQKIREQKQAQTVKRFDSSAGIRKKYLNSKQGFAMCTEFTTLFDPKDMSCIRCQNRKDCKELLRVNYPALFGCRIK